jgi:hypothetical protein
MENLEYLSAASLISPKGKHQSVGHFGGFFVSVTGTALVLSPFTLSNRGNRHSVANSNIPETRHDLAAICGIKTRLFGALITSEVQLKPQTG